MEHYCQWAAASTAGAPPPVVSTTAGNLACTVLRMHPKRPRRPVVVGKSQIGGTPNGAPINGEQERGQHDRAWKAGGILVYRHSR